MRNTSSQWECCIAWSGGNAQLIECGFKCNQGNTECQKAIKHPTKHFEQRAWKLQSSSGVSKLSSNSMNLSGILGADQNLWVFLSIGFQKWNFVDCVQLEDILRRLHRDCTKSKLDANISAQLTFSNPCSHNFMRLQKIQISTFKQNGLLPQQCQLSLFQDQGFWLSLQEWLHCWSAVCCVVQEGALAS